MNAPFLCINVAKTKTETRYVLQDMAKNTMVVTREEILKAKSKFSPHIINMTITKDNKIVLLPPGRWNAASKRQAEMLKVRNNRVRVDTTKKIILCPGSHGIDVYMGIAKLLSEGYTYQHELYGSEEGYSHRNFNYSYVTAENTQDMLSCITKALRLTKTSYNQHYEARKNEGDFDD